MTQAGVVLAWVPAVKALSPLAKGKWLVGVQRGRVYGGYIRGRGYGEAGEVHGERER